uniref:Uncharacterized protein n=1 Tax=Arundo donax TaxID=35708 RepID=A0A0A9FUM1_ARUDO
MAALLCTRW